jgi:2-polyprenyl-3-methyl-5-hydroxy-6-metoxy-1,4-benzoquinol methylase
MLIQTPCGVCGGEAFRPVYDSTIAPNDPDPSRYFSSSREKAGHLRIVRCMACGLVMTNPRDDDATLQRVYAALADRASHEDTDREWAARSHLNLVQSYSHPPGRLLDVGCATGLFVHVAAQNGWDAMGLEASTWAVTQARRHRVGRFETGFVETARLANASFDVVTLWDVLEHVPSPGTALDRIGRWMKPGGHLFMSVPNVASLTARFMRGAWVLLLREHLWYFSPKTIAILLDRAGFGVTTTRRKYVRFSVATILGRLGQYEGLVGDVARRLADRRLGAGTSIRFAMGEMHVVARRRGG